MNQACIFCDLVNVDQQSQQLPMQHFCTSAAMRAKYWLKDTE